MSFKIRALCDTVLRILSFHNHLTIVGDEDQSIYSFSGADISGFNSFSEGFPTHKEVIRVILSMLRATLPGCDDNSFQRAIEALLPVDKKEKKKGYCALAESCLNDDEAFQYAKHIGHLHTWLHYHGFPSSCAKPVSPTYGLKQDIGVFSAILRDGTRKVAEAYVD